MRGLGEILFIGEPDESCPKRTRFRRAELDRITLASHGADGDAAAVEAPGIKPDGKGPVVPVLKTTA